MPITSRAQVAALPPPEGFRWALRPAFNNEYYLLGEQYRESWFARGELYIHNAENLNEAEYCSRLRALYTWGRAHDVYIKAFDYGYYGQEWNAEILVRWVVTVQMSGAGSRYSWLDNCRELTCSNGHTWNGGWICPECSESLTCIICRRYRGDVSLRHLDSAGGLVCQNCTRICGYRSGTNERCTELVIAGRRIYCDTHGDPQPCAGANCTKVLEIGNRYSGSNNTYYCSTCRARYCDICETQVHRATHLNAFELYVCAACIAATPELDESKPLSEEFDEGAELTAEVLKLDPAAARPIRMCSIELEATAGGAALAKALFEAGLSSRDGVRGYHSSANDFCHVERDGSLGDQGGELIFNRILLDNDEDVQKLHQGVSIMRQLVKEKKLGMDTRCGLHIHVDAHNMGINHVRNLALIHNYLEDVLYRLSAAKYLRHRGQGYATKSAKGELYFKDTVAFGLHFMSTSGHHSALNLSNYWRAVNNNCSCGHASLYKDVVRCQCNLGKCTFEFRVYNGTTNFRKIHAYSALSQSMVAYARAFDELNEVELPAMEFVPFYKDVEPVIPEWTSRLRWLFRNLYFSDAERDSMLYVLKNSSLAVVGEDTINALGQLEYAGPSAADYQIIHRNARSNTPDADSEIVSPGPPEYDDDPYWDEVDEDPFG